MKVYEEFEADADAALLEEAADEVQAGLEVEVVSTEAEPTEAAPTEVEPTEVEPAEAAEAEVAPVEATDETPLAD